jgi:hypothetical protein
VLVIAIIISASCCSVRQLVVQVHKVSVLALEKRDVKVRLSCLKFP